jgi:hypothetical protein
MYSKGAREIEKEAKMKEDYQLMFSSVHFYLLNKFFLDDFVMICIMMWWSHWGFIPTFSHNSH